MGMFDASSYCLPKYEEDSIRRVKMVIKPYINLQDIKENHAANYTVNH